MKRSRIAALLDAVTAGPATLGGAFALVGFVAHFRSKLTRAELHKLRIAAYREVGLVDRKRCRDTGRSLFIYDSKQGFDSDDSGERYAVLCDEHATLVYVGTLAHARDTTCLSFCDECREERKAQGGTI